MKQSSTRLTWPIDACIMSVRNKVNSGSPVSPSRRRPWTLQDRETAVDRSCVQSPRRPSLELTTSSHAWTVVVTEAFVLLIRRTSWQVASSFNGFSRRPSTVETNFIVHFICKSVHMSKMEVGCKKLTSRGCGKHGKCKVPISAGVRSHSKFSVRWFILCQRTFPVA